MKICFLCDLHLPYHTEAIQYDVLRWAVEDLQKKQAEALIVPGDFTLNGDINAAEAFLAALRPLSVPVVMCTGNSEYRKPETKAYFRRMASPACNDIGNGWTVIALHDGEGALTDEDYAALETADSHCLVVLHHPFHSLPSPHGEKLTAWHTEHPEIPVFFGHLHYAKEDGNIHMLAAADPDKAIGGHPSIAYYDTETGKMETVCYHCPIPNGFLQHIGLSCYHPETDIPYAAENGIHCIELRPDAAGKDPEELDTLLSAWRSAGGSCLSLHAPELPIGDMDPATDAVWENFIKLAERTSPERLTIHVPGIPLVRLQEEQDLLEKTADTAAQLIGRFSSACVIGLENMHTKKGDTADLRNYGCTPAECMEFIRLLRNRCSRKIGMHLDVGHARNNIPLASSCSLACWYEEVGTETVGYHIHQVTLEPDGFHNHNPIADFYEPLINYASFFRRWNEGHLNPVPVILEILPTAKDPMPYRCTIELLQREAQRNVFDLHSHTRYSFCGRDDPRKLIDTAVANSIRLFGICDHNYGIGSRKQEYLKEMRQLAEDSRDKLRLAVGIEIATIPDHFDISDPAEIAAYDYCLIEHITSPESIVGGELFGFCERMGILCGIAHTDIFAYCDIYGYAYESFFTEMAKRRIFWELNVSYDSIHRYHEHGYVKAFLSDPVKQDLIRRTGVYVSVGFDGHRREDYDGSRVFRMYDFLKEGGFRMADELFEHI